LGDHFRRGVRIEKAVPDDLPDEFRRSPVVRLRAAFLTLQGHRAFLAKGGTELKVTLSAVVELLRGPARPKALAFAFDEHEKLAGDFVLRRDLQQTAGSDHRMFLQIELSGGIACVFPDSIPSSDRRTFPGVSISIDGSTHGVVGLGSKKAPG
jgi:hypothetical protein